MKSSIRFVCATLGLLLAPVASAQSTAPASSIDSRMELRPVDRACVRIVTVHGAVPLVRDSRETRVRRLYANVSAAFGTGFFVDPNGLIATAGHVTAGADLVAVILTGQDEPQPASLVYVDPIHDIAFLRVAVTPPAFVDVPSAQRRLTISEPVFASGFPLDVRERYPAAIEGVISRENNDGSIHTSLSVNPGNSGGPVVDARGGLVGLISRGSNMRAGAQGFGLLEPVRYLAPDVALARQLATTRPAAPTDYDHKLARVLADLVGTDTERRIFERTPVDVVLAAGAMPPSPEAAMVVAAHAWNMHISLLEHHAVREIAQLPAEDQSNASSLRGLAVRLVQVAMGQAPYLRSSYSFGRSLLVQGDRSFVVRGVGEH